jgi:hypothetical protein
MQTEARRERLKKMLGAMPTEQAMPEPQMARGGKVKDIVKSAITSAAEKAGIKAPVTANKDLTTLQDFHTSVMDRVRQGAAETQNMIESMPFKYDKGQRVFTDDSFKKNKPPYTILERTRFGNQVIYDTGGGMKPRRDPDTGKVMRTPYEPGYKVRQGDGDDYMEFVIPESAIRGDVEMAKGGAAKQRVAETLREVVEAIREKVGRNKPKKAKEDDHPLVFPRADPKNKEELRPIAQRIAQQMTNEFVRQDPKTTMNVAGKSKKQWQREQNIPLEVRNVVPPKDVPKIDYEKYKDYAIVGVPGDPSLGGVSSKGSFAQAARPTVELTRVGDITPDYPVPLYGGPRYGDEERFWASNYSAAQPVQSNVNELGALYESPVLGQYIKMAPDSANFALHNLDSLLAIQRPEQLSKEKREILNDLIRKGSKKYGQFPGFAGVEDPVDVLLQAQINSKLRKHIAETLTKPQITDALGLPLGKDVVAAITHPELRNLETGISGFSVGQMTPGAKLQKGLSEHPTYDTDIPGALIGQSKYPVPYEIAFPDTTAYARSQLKPGVQEFNMMKLLGPRERIDQQYIDEIKMFEELMKQYTGKKKGGAVQSGLSALQR